MLQVMTYNPFGSVVSKAVPGENHLTGTILGPKGTTESGEKGPEH